MNDGVWLLNLAGVVGFFLLVGVLGRDRSFRYLALNLVLLQAWSLISCLYLTTGQYSFELGLTTHANLAPLTLAFYNAAFFIPMWWIMRRLQSAGEVVTLHHRGILLDVVVLGVAGLSAIYLYQGFVGNGVPLFTHESRQWFQARVYWTTPLGRVVSGSLGMLALLLGVVTAKHLHPTRPIGYLLRAWAVVIVIALLVQQVLAGNKFSSLFWIAFFYGLPYLLFSDKTVLARLTRGLFFRRALVIVLVVGGVYGSYRLARAAYEGDVQVSIASRVFVLQGELWWVVHDRVFSDFEGNSKQLTIEMRRLETKSERHAVGLRYLMEQYADPRVVNSMFAAIAGFTAGYPAIVLELFGPFVAIGIQIGFGLLSGALAMLLMRFIAAGQYVRIYLVGTIYVLANSVFTMGTFEDVFKPTTFYKLAMLVAILFGEAVVVRGLPSAMPRAVPVTGPNPLRT